MTDAEVARHADSERLLYKDPRTFIALLILVLLAILISEVV